MRTLNHLTLTVSDPKRSLEFYQGLFGMPVLARQGDKAISLQIGPGAHLGLARSMPNAKPEINHFCMTTEGFNVDRILRTLADHGVTKSEPVAAGVSAGMGGLSGGPMRARVRMRGEDLGGAKEQTPEVYLGDPDGIVVQLQDTTYCAGAGALGNVCPATPEPAPRKGLIAVRGLSHFTLNVSNLQRSLAFYRELFGMPVQAHQGSTTLLAVGSGPQFIALGSGQANVATPKIAHFCLTMEGFEPDRIFKLLAEYGVRPGKAAGPHGPLTSYVSRRMEDRGGEKEGTPEVYFTDPDGIVVQLQHVSYCGGSGYLGNVCQ